jgi:hypothetical protein
MGLHGLLQGQLYLLIRRFLKLCQWLKYYTSILQIKGLMLFISNFILVVSLVTISPLSFLSSVLFGIFVVYIVVFPVPLKILLVKRSVWLKDTNTEKTQTYIHARMEFESAVPLFGWLKRVCLRLWSLWKRNGLDCIRSESRRSMGRNQTLISCFLFMDIAYKSKQHSQTYTLVNIWNGMHM